MDAPPDALEPENIEAEMGVLGALICDGASVLSLSDELQAEHFFDPFLGTMWEAGVGLVREHGTVHASALLAKLPQEPAYQDHTLLGELIDKAPGSAAISSLVSSILNAARLRRLRTMALDLYGRADRNADAFNLISGAEREITALLRDSAPASANLVDAQSAAAALVKRLDEEAVRGRPRGAMTGLRCFDRRLRGLRPGWLVILAGRPSMGKTALARAAALGCARRNPQSRVLFFALEMDRDELSERTLSQITREADEGIAYKDMHGDVLTPEERATLKLAAQRVPTNFIIDDSPVLSVDYVRRRALAERRRGPIAAIVIDYLQIMERPESGRRTDAAILGDMTRALKQLAREVGCCIILLSQLSRAVEGRDDKRPQLSDLRESGSIEQDANAVFFPYREAYYLERSPPKRGASADKVAEWEMACHDARHRLDVICAKARAAAIGSDEQHYEPPFDLVRDVD